MPNVDEQSGLVRVSSSCERFCCEALLLCSTHVSIVSVKDSRAGKTSSGRSICSSITYIYTVQPFQMCNSTGTDAPYYHHRCRLVNQVDGLFILQELWMIWPQRSFSLLLWLFLAQRKQQRFWWMEVFLYPPPRPPRCIDVHDGITPVFNAVTRQDRKITGIQYQFSGESTEILWVFCTADDDRSIHNSTFKNITLKLFHIFKTLPPFLYSAILPPCCN